MKQYTFKDGYKCVASTEEEAIKKHKVVASKPASPKLTELTKKGNVRLERTGGNDYELVLSVKDKDISDLDGMWLGDIIKKDDGYWFHTEGLDCKLEDISKIKKSVNNFIQYEIDKLIEKEASLKALKF